MAGTVVAVFEDNRQAERAAQALLDDGVVLNDITLVRKNAGGETGAPQKEGNAPEEKDEEFLTTEVREVPAHDVEQPLNTVDEVGPRVVVGIVTGAPLGALAVALSTFIPSMGALMDAHPLMPTLVGSLAGAIIGALIGGYTAGGIPAEVSRSYHANVARGDTLVTVLASNTNADHFQDILRQHGGRKIGYFTRFIDSLQALES